MINRLIVWFYCLPLHQVVILYFVCTAIFSYLSKRFNHHICWKAAVFLLCTAWASLIVWSTVTSRQEAGSFEHYFIPFHSYRAVMNGGNIEILRSNFMNVVLFYPAGLMLCSLLPEKWQGWRKVFVVVVVFCTLSGGIEYVQYVCSLGQVEIDDVIHNSLGAFLGAVLCIIPLEPWRWFQIIPPSQ